MKAERWKEVERLYHNTLERRPEERAAYLAEVCSNDEALRREVESLLAYQAESEDFIESPALNVAAKMIARDTGASVVVGQTINQYTIISQIGAGGMGEVYLAEDSRLRRQVYLPVYLPTDERLDHLRSESRFKDLIRKVGLPE